MTTADSRTLRETFCRVIETAAFLCGEPVAKGDVGKTPEDAVCARMRFSGDLTGSIAVAAPAPLAPLIAANMLGVEPDASEARDRSNDAFREMVNVLCGQVLAAMTDGRGRFGLSVPELSYLHPAGWQAILDRPGTMAFRAEGVPILLEVQAQGDRA